MTKKDVPGGKFFKDFIYIIVGLCVFAMYTQGWLIPTIKGGISILVVGGFGWIIYCYVTDDESRSYQQ